MKKFSVTFLIPENVTSDVNCVVSKYLKLINLLIYNLKIIIQSLQKIFTKIFTANGRAEACAKTQPKYVLVTLAPNATNKIIANDMKILLSYALFFKP